MNSSSFFEIEASDPFPKHHGIFICIFFSLWGLERYINLLQHFLSSQFTNCQSAVPPKVKLNLS